MLCDVVATLGWKVEMLVLRAANSQSSRIILLLLLMMSCARKVLCHGATLRSPVECSDIQRNNIKLLAGQLVKWSVSPKPDFKKNNARNLYLLLSVIKLFRRWKSCVYCLCSSAAAADDDDGVSCNYRYCIQLLTWQVSTGLKSLWLNYLCKSYIYRTLQYVAYCSDDEVQL